MTNVPPPDPEIPNEKRPANEVPDSGSGARPENVAPQSERDAQPLPPDEFSEDVEDDNA